MSNLHAFFAKELRARLLRDRVIQDDRKESVEVGLGPCVVRMGEGAGVLLGLALAALLWLGFGLAIAFLEAETFDLLLIGLFALLVVQGRTRGEALVFAIGLPVLPLVVLAAIDLIGGFGGTVGEWFPDTYTWSLVGITMSIYAFREACTRLLPSPVPLENPPPVN